MDNGNKISTPWPSVLTIAGSDPSGGAGIQADLKTFQDCQVNGLSVITVVTAQSHRCFRNLYILPKKVFTSQMDLILKEYEIKAIKTGLLYHKQFIDLIIKRMNKLSDARLIVDPVMDATFDFRLLKQKALDSLKKLISLSYLVTPNLHESSILADMKLNNVEDMKQAAKKIYSLGPKHVLVKGGHLKEDPVDILFDGHEFFEYSKKRIFGLSFHGLGCRLSAVMCAYLGKGLEIKEAVLKAQHYMDDAMTKEVTWKSGFRV